MKQELFDFAGSSNTEVAAPLQDADMAETQVRNPAPADLPRSTWNEVPAALFLSWPPAMQWAYCAAARTPFRISANHGNVPGLFLEETDRCVCVVRAFGARPAMPIRWTSAAEHCVCSAASAADW